MNRRTADLAFALSLVAIVSVGGLLTWQAFQRQRSTADMMDSMMGDSTGAMHGTDPAVYVLGTLLVAVALVAGYLLYRRPTPSAAVVTGPTTDGGTDAADPGPAPTEPEPAQATGDATSDPDTGDADVASADEDAVRRLLAVLPEDERRVLEPVVESPGVTQIALRDRSDFSKSKVSQTVSELEKRGLLYRERQGRTYRVYPSDDLGDRLDSRS